jgi:hypothetical protein
MDSTALAVGRCAWRGAAGVSCIPCTVSRSCPLLWLAGWVMAGCEGRHSMIGMATPLMSALFCSLADHPDMSCTVSTSLLVTGGWRNQGVVFPDLRPCTWSWLTG